MLNTAKFRTTPSYKADIIVSLGGGDSDRLKRARALYEEGYSLQNKLLLTGSPDDPAKVRYKDPRELYLEKHPEITYIPISHKEAKSTWEEGLFIKRYMLEHGYKSVIVVTHPLHAARVEMVLEKVAGLKSEGLRYEVVVTTAMPKHLCRDLLYDRYTRDYVWRELYKQVYYEVRYLWFWTVKHIFKMVEYIV